MFASPGLNIAALLLTFLLFPLPLALGRLVLTMVAVFGLAALVGRLFDQPVANGAAVVRMQTLEREMGSQTARSMVSRFLRSIVAGADWRPQSRARPRRPNASWPRRSTSRVKASLCCGILGFSLRSRRLFGLEVRWGWGKAPVNPGPLPGWTTPLHTARMASQSMGVTLPSWRRSTARGRRSGGWCTCNCRRRRWSWISSGASTADCPEHRRRSIALAPAAQAVSVQPGPGRLR